jgi:transcriptional regulator with PAS, ATPase and Fis domain
MLISSSKTMLDVVNLAEKSSKFPVNILILGETGCGKELIARHIHETSECDGKFLGINCTALPRELLESELFGYSKGAFTGAYKSKKGIMEETKGGSLLLDEVGDMPIALQPKLLRVLDTKEFTPLGSTSCKKFDTKVISTTNMNLSNQTTFRQDLYFRLGTIIINIPPLKNRPDDILSLTNYFLGKIQEDFKLEEFPTIKNNDIYTLLLKYPWPGNVRELQNVLKRAIILGDGYLEYDIVKDIIDYGAKFFDVEKNIDSVFIWKDTDHRNLKKANLELGKHIVKHIIETEPKITNTALANILGISMPTLLSRFRDIISNRRKK